MYNYLKGKRVAIVGPALSVEGSKNGSFIDSHDVVVRLNYANINNPKDSGTKTDIVYYDGSLHNYGDLKLDYLVCAYPKTEWFFEERCLKSVQYLSTLYNHKVVDSGIYTQLKNSLDKDNTVRPNTGLIAIVDLLQSELRSLFITGLDFYRSSYVKEHPDYGNTDLTEISRIFKSGDNGDYHDVEKQFEYFQQHIITDPRLKIDSFLEQFVNFKL